MRPRTPMRATRIAVAAMAAAAASWGLQQWGEGSSRHRGDLAAEPPRQVLFLPVTLRRGSPHADDQPLYGMRVEAVVRGPRGATVTTTGARYVLDTADLALWRRIDPTTNADDPRLVATVGFDRALGPLTWDAPRARQAVVQSDRVRFAFQPDGLVLLEALQPLTLTFRSEIGEAPWAKGQRSDRMWTDGYGGSLHARFAGTPEVLAAGPDHTRIALVAGDTLAVMAFPPRPFDFERLYGRQARPFALFVYSDAVLDATVDRLADYAGDGFGVIVLWCGIYDWSGMSSCAEPIVLASGLRGYRLRDDRAEAVHAFVAAAHAAGYDVIPYLSYPSGPRWDYPDGHPRAGTHQPVETTLAWMRAFQSAHGFDGWYLDNADAGDLRADYGFMRQLRLDVGDGGTLYHHDSVDVWGGWSGLRAVMVDAYVDYTLTGETGGAGQERAEVADANDPYLRYYTAGYGLSQALASHKRLSSMRAAISEAEKNRVLGQNLHGAERATAYNVDRTAYDAWLASFGLGYRLRRSTYLSGSFDPDVDWPLAPARAWFRPAADARAEAVAAGAIAVNWHTDAPADSRVALSSRGVWWPSPRDPGPEAEAHDAALVRDHRLEVTGLEPGTAYAVRIRSTNGRAGAEEVIWGALLEGVTATAADNGEPPTGP